MTSLALRSRARSQTGETELIARARSGDVAASEELAGTCVDRVFALALRLLGDRAEAEDVVQETLLRAWRGIRGSVAARVSPPGCIGSPSMRSPEPWRRARGDRGRSALRPSTPS